MAKLTRKRAIKLHRQLWNWLAKNPDKGKGDWPEWEYNGGKIQSCNNDCFACEVTAVISGLEDCYKCLFDWGKFPTCGTGCIKGLYSSWLVAKTKKNKAKIALEIANLPERRA